MSKANVRNIQKEVLSDQWYTLSRVSFEHQKKDGTWTRQTRECYDMGDGAVILLYHPKAKTVILTSQFRIPTYVNGNKEGNLIECIAGKLDEDDPETCAIRETHKEAGYTIAKPTKVFELYQSPGAITEILHYFVAEYTPAQKTSEGGGLADENEEIEILELPIDEAMAKIKSGEIKDAKTVILLQHLKLSGLI